MCVGCGRSLNLQSVPPFPLPQNFHTSRFNISFGFGCFSSLNFGVPLVVYSKGKVINAKEVVATLPQPQPKLETVLITLMHLALHSDKVELEVNY